MSWNEGLVDLSLFACSPTDDRHFAIAGTSHRPAIPLIPRDDFTPPLYTRAEFYAPRDTPEHQRGMTQTRHEFYAPWSTLGDHEESRFTRHETPSNSTEQRTEPNHTRQELDAPSNAIVDDRDFNLSKPLPPLPPRTLCRTISIPRECDDESACIIARMKRKRTHESPTRNSNNLLQRRNVAAPPQLTLSVPSSTSPNHNPVTEMVWMPREQIWIVSDNARQDRYPSPANYPTPPTYSPPENFSRSEPPTRHQSRFTITPPMSPIQSQLLSLIQPRDEERLSPLFQEAMNSVPMDDMFDPPPPPTYEGTVRNNIPRSAPLSNRQWRQIPLPPPPPTPPPRNPPTRAASSAHSTHSTFASAYSENSNNLSRSQTQGSKQPGIKPATSKYGIWTPKFGNSQKPATRGRSPPENSEGHQSPLDFLHQEMAGSSRSWHGLARKVAVSRPRSAT